MQSVYFGHHLEYQRIFVRPMLVDGSFADAGVSCNGIHAGGIYTLARNQRDSSIQNFLVSASATASRHYQIWIFEKRWLPISSSIVATVTSTSPSSPIP